MTMPPLALLAGGLGTRLGSLAKKIPKSMVEINGEPFIAHQLRLFKREGISDIVICAGYLGEQIHDFVGDGRDFGLNVTWSFDGEQLLGTGGSLIKALPMLGDSFLTTYGDSYLDIQYSPIIKQFEGSNCHSLMVVIRNKDAWDSSNAVLQDGMVIRYGKEDKTPDMEYIDYGLSVFRAEAFASFAPGEKVDLSEVHIRLIKKKALAGCEVFKRFYEIGSAQGIRDTEDYLRTTAN